MPLSVSTSLSRQQHERNLDDGSFGDVVTHGRTRSTQERISDGHAHVPRCSMRHSLLRSLRRQLRRQLYRRQPFPDVFRELRCIFIHIPKTAGVSVRTALAGDQLWATHKPVRYYERFYPDELRKSFVFTVARNPYSRIYSAYRFLQAGGRNDGDARWARENLRQFSSFENFVMSLRSRGIRRRILRWQHFRPQTWYLAGRDGQIAVEKICRFENLDHDIATVGDAISHQLVLPKLNYTSYERCHYTADMAETVAGVYNTDFRVLAYDPADVP